MAFGVTAVPDSFPLLSGGVQDVVFTFTEVPGNESATETFGLAGLEILVTLTITGADPTSVGFTVPTGVTREVVSIDDAQAVIRYTRA